MKNLLRIVFLLSYTHISFAQSSTPNKDWVQENYVSTHENVMEMISKVWGTENSEQANYLAELQCLAFSKMLITMSKSEANFSYLEQAMNKWSQYKGVDRAEKNWWEWPDTNWIKVEYEYKYLTEMEGSLSTGSN